jgi:hypothetical protein
VARGVPLMVMAPVVGSGGLMVRLVPHPSPVPPLTTSLASHYTQILEEHFRSAAKPGAASSRTLSHLLAGIATSPYRTTASTFRTVLCQYIPNNGGLQYLKNESP